MKIGFTGTREGMTLKQQVRLEWELSQYRGLKEFHFGCCRGADEEAADIAKNLDYDLHAHPPEDLTYISEDWRKILKVVYPPKSYMSRNQDIVNLTQRIYATPKEESWQATGGTWRTCEYAVLVRKPLMVIFPNGKTELHNWV